jgi:hypothetical protein
MLIEDKCTDPWFQMLTFDQLRHAREYTKANENSVKLTCAVQPRNAGFCSYQN